MKPALITIDPQVMMGKPCVAGTRITVEHVLEEMAYGRTIMELVEGHPRLTPEAIEAALLFAIQAVRGDAVYSFALATA